MAALASAAGISPSNLSNYERGLSQPREATLGVILMLRGIRQKL